MNRYHNFSEECFGDKREAGDRLGRLPGLALPKEDIAILRGLGRKKHEYADLPVMARNRRIWTNTNDLQMTRPPIFVNEICWQEMNPDGELTLRCAHPLARDLEDNLRKELYCFEHGLGDVVIEDYIENPLVVYDSGFGIDEVTDLRQTDRNSEIVSRHFHILIEGMDDIAKIREPEIVLDAERTAQYMELLQEAFDGVIDVRQVGSRGLWFTPLDYLVRVLGVEETYVNLIEEPEFIEAVVKRYVDCCMVRMRKYRELGVWASNNAPCRVGSGGYGLVSCLAPGESAPTGCDTKQMWGCGNAQIFSDVSPDMHWQFSLQYEMEWLKQFGVTYYGCCEPLWNKMDILDRIPNLRKVSMSPWNRLSAAAERCRGKYVMSCKPSPAIFAVGAFDEDNAREDVRRILRETAGCSIEIVMKDISTVDYKPQKLWRWAELAREAVGEMYGAA